MCGRYALTLPPEAVRAFFGYLEQPNFPPRYNIAPTQPIAIVRRVPFEPGAPRHFALVRWGFVPAFVKQFDQFRPFVNARSEGLVEKPSFRNAFRRRRCLVLADGFYEWRKQGKGPSQPFLIRSRNEAPLGLAGLFETWIGADGSEIETACIITTDSNSDLAAIHPRMPVLIDQADVDLWLDPDERAADEAATLMRPAPSGVLKAMPIGTGVNAVANDDPAIQAPIALSEPLPLAAPPNEPLPRQGSLF